MKSIRLEKLIFAASCLSSVVIISITCEPFLDRLLWREMKEVFSLELVNLLWLDWFFLKSKDFCDALFPYPNWLLFKMLDNSSFEFYIYFFDYKFKSQFELTFTFKLEYSVLSFEHETYLRGFCLGSF